MAWTEASSIIWFLKKYSGQKFATSTSDIMFITQNNQSKYLQWSDVQHKVQNMLDAYCVALLHRLFDVVGRTPFILHLQIQNQIDCHPLFRSMQQIFDPCQANKQWLQSPKKWTWMRNKLLDQFGDCALTLNSKQCVCSACTLQWCMSKWSSTVRMHLLILLIIHNHPISGCVVHSCISYAICNPPITIYSTQNVVNGSVSSSPFHLQHI